MEAKAEVNKLFERLQKDYANLRFLQGKKFAFRPGEGSGTVIFEAIEEWKDVQEYQLCLLHEVGHALLEHKNFKMDAERVKMECAAWEKARELCAKYGIEYNEEVAQGRLDSYRDWLHQRSRCRNCGLTRFQTRDGEYHCPGCGNLR